MEEWQEESLKYAEQSYVERCISLRNRLTKDVDALLKVWGIKKKIIPNLREKPNSIFSNTTHLFVKSENPLLAHDVSRTLGITLEKVPESDGFNYKGKYRDVNVTVYGAQEAFGCKIKFKEVMEKRKVYVMDCNHKEK